MTRWLPTSLFVLGLAFVGCTRSEPKDNGGKENKVVRDGAKDQAKPDDPKGGKADKDGKGSQKPAAPVPDIKIEARAMATEFVADEKNAVSKFKGKVVEVTGDVVTCSHACIHFDGMVIKGGNRVSILCDVLPEDFDKAMRASRRQAVRLTGEFEHYINGNIITMRKCRYAELEPTKILVASAESIAKEFETDANAAIHKYAGEDVILTGTIEESEYAKEGETFVKLKGAGKTRLRIPMLQYSDLTRLKQWKNADPVEIRTSFTSLELRFVLIDNEIRFLSGFLLALKQSEE